MANLNRPTRRCQRRPSPRRILPDPIRRRGPGRRRFPLFPKAMMTTRFTRCVTRSAGAVFLTSLLAVVSPANAQRSTGTVRGVVTNADTRAPIMGARVAIANPERVAITDERGTYALRDVPAGMYSVLTTAVGRKPDSSSVTVRGGATVSLEVALKQGSL